MPLSLASQDVGVLQRIAHSPNLFVFLDFDGTIAPIASAPALARLPVAVKKTLMLLARQSNVKIAVVSGRTLDDVRAKVNIRGLWYAGNHGCQIFIAGKRREACLPAAISQALSEVFQLLQRELGVLPGIIIEDKKIGVTVHYRQVPLSLLPEALRRIRCLSAQVLRRNSFLTLNPGKKVFEFFPNLNCDKGQAVKAMLKAWNRRNVLAVYIGDDLTDETAFAALKGKGITIKVGATRSRTQAEYCLKNADAVGGFLKEIAVARSELS